MPEPIGDRLDKMLVRATLGPDDLVSDAVVVLKVVDGEGRVRLSLAWSDGMSWIERLGMLHAAELIERPNGLEADDDD